jgi:TonB family protein
MTPLLYAALLPLSIVLKATALAAVGLVSAWFLRRNRAAVRHALLAASFAVLLLVPVAAIFAPPILIAVPGPLEKAIAPIGPTHAISSARPVRARPQTTPASPPPEALSPSALLLAAWIAGSALFLAPVATGLWQVRKLRRSALPWRQGQALAESIALDAGVHRRVEVLLHESLSGPMTCGVRYPAIVLSPDAQDWNAEDLHRAMVHELEHVRRFDWVSQCLARAICALYWFHPLVWIARNRLALEAERSCDDAVLRSSEPAAYADQLVGLAQRLSAATQTPLLTMANRADLAVRIGAVLDGQQRRGRAGACSVALACAAAAMLVLTISPLRVVAAPQTPSVATGAVFSANVQLVIADVMVTDPSGAPIEGLTANDFVITDEGEPQHISLFEFQKLTADTSSVVSYYILGYYPPNQLAGDDFRKIRIALTGGRVAKLSFRSGYYPQRPRNTQPIAVPPPSGSIDRTVTAPVLISKTEPEYSEAARKAKHQGTIVLDVEIDETGNVIGVHVLKSLGLGLDEKAVEAVQQWKFRPGMKSGNPVPVETSVEVSFRLL